MSGFKFRLQQKLNLSTHPIVRDIDYERDAASHKAADNDCGREWTCQCGACRIVRRASSTPREDQG